MRLERHRRKPSTGEALRRPNRKGQPPSPHGARVGIRLRAAARPPIGHRRPNHQIDVIAINRRTRRVDLMAHHRHAHLGAYLGAHLGAHLNGVACGRVAVGTVDCHGRSPTISSKLRVFHAAAKTVSSRPMSRTFSFIAFPSLALVAISLTACAGPRPMTAAKQEADRAFQYGQYDKAVVGYAEILERAPGDWQVEYRYGVSLAEVGNLAEARTHVETAYAANPASQEVAAGLAHVYFKLNEKQKLVQLLQQRGSNLNSLDSYMLLADYGIKMNDPDTATMAVNGAILLADGNNFQPYLMAVTVAEDVGDSKLATRRLRQAYTIAPKSGAVRAKAAEYGLALEPTTGLPPGQ